MDLPWLPFLLLKVISATRGISEESEENGAGAVSGAVV